MSGNNKGTATLLPADLKKIRQCLAQYSNIKGKNAKLKALCERLVKTEGKLDTTNKKLDTTQKEKEAWKNVATDQAGKHLKEAVKSQLLKYEVELRAGLNGFKSWYLGNYSDFLGYAYNNPKLSSPPAVLNFAKKIFGDKVTGKIAEGIGEKAANKIFRRVFANLVQEVTDDKLFEILKDKASEKFGTVAGAAIGTALLPVVGTVVGAVIGIVLDYATEATQTFITGDATNKAKGKTAKIVTAQFKAQLQNLDATIEKIITAYKTEVNNITEQLGKAIDKKIISMDNQSAQVFAYNIAKNKQLIQQTISTKVAPYFEQLKKVKKDDRTLCAALVSKWLKENQTDANEAKDIDDIAVHNALKYLQNLDTNNNDDDDAYDLPDAVGAKILGSWNYSKGQIDAPYHTLVKKIKEMGFASTAVDQKMAYLSKLQQDRNKKAAKKKQKPFNTKEVNEHKTTIEGKIINMGLPLLKDVSKLHAAMEKRGGAAGDHLILKEYLNQTYKEKIESLLLTVSVDLREDGDSLFIKSYDFSIKGKIKGAKKGFDFSWTEKHA